VEWDVFISHAWEDKESIARPLAEALRARGLRVWYDEFTLTVGDRLRRSIDRGLANSRYGIVILSPHFFAKEWPQIELDGLLQRESNGDKVVLPVWHEIGFESIRDYSPTLADRLGIASSQGLPQVVAGLMRGMHLDPETGNSLAIASPVHLDLVLIQADEFLMGSDRSLDPAADDNEMPQHRENVREFSIGKYPVTNAQYAAFVAATRHMAPGHWKAGKLPVGKEDHPVVNVSWYDAVEFCRWQSESGGMGVRLPTEAEWEMAARGADGRLYPWGNDSPDWTRCNFKGEVGDTTPVGQYPKGASPYGVFDMSGNVWEWCLTKWRQNYETPPDDDPGESGRHVLRGGAFYTDASEVRCAARNGFGMLSVGRFIGFRVAASSIVPGSGL
jgi:formylglycine-generating enzyme required for sulfatase activity